MHLFIGKTSGLLSQAFDSAPLSEKGRFGSFDVLLKIHVKSKSMTQSDSVSSDLVRRKVALKLGCTLLLLG